MDLNLDTLKSEITQYLEEGGFAIFHSTSGGLEGMPLVLWETEEFPDFRMFLETAAQVGTKLILLATSEFTEEELDDTLSQLDAADLVRDERADLESRLADLRPYVGLTCSLELAYDYQTRFYVFELRPDWYEDFLNIGDEIEAHIPAASEEDGSLGGLFSNN